MLRLSFDSFCIYMACFHFLTSYFLLFLFNCCCPDICMISELRRQNNMQEFHPSHTKTICIFIVFGYNTRVFRGVAQPGRVLAWGARGRRFESCHPDHKNKNRPCVGFCFYQWVCRFDALHCYTMPGSSRSVSVGERAPPHKAVGITILSPRP